MAKNDKIYDILIIGAGAAGLFLAANLHGKSVAIFEKNAVVGKKILASGGGRCNITNRYISAKNYLGDEKFISQILKNLNFKDVLKFFNELKFSEQKQNQFFCESGARDVLGVLLKRVRQSGVQIFCGVEVVDARKIYRDKEGRICEKFGKSDAPNLALSDQICKFNEPNLNTSLKANQLENEVKFNSNGLNLDEIFEIATTNGDKFYAKNLVVASGGLSYKSLGASDIGHKIAAGFGLRVVTPSPALVGFTVQKGEFWFKNLSGVCFGAQVGVGERKFIGDVLFTHRGVSGPVMLNASLFWQKGAINVNFVPKFDLQNLRGTRKQISSVLPLPRRFTLEFLGAIGVSDGVFDALDKVQQDEILRLFDYKFAPAGTFGFERAEVTRGGVDTSGVSANCESVDVAGLYFIGEVLDATGMLGGYNLHFAFASALAVAQNLTTKA